MNEENNLEEIISRIPKVFEADIYRERIHIHKPAFINLNPPITIKESDITIELENKKVSIILWKKHGTMHITVQKEDRK